MSLIIYDKELSKVVKGLHNAWDECLSHGSYFRPLSSQEAFTFSNPGDLPFIEDQQIAWDTMIAAAKKTKRYYDKLLNIVRDKYIEIDVDEMSKTAWNGYVDFHRNLKKEWTDQRHKKADQTNDLDKENN